MPYTVAAATDFGQASRVRPMSSCRFSRQVWSLADFE